MLQRPACRSVWQTCFHSRAFPAKEAVGSHSGAGVADLVGEAALRISHLLMHLGHTPLYAMFSLGEEGGTPGRPSRHTPPVTVKTKATHLSLSFSLESQFLHKVTGVCSRKGFLSWGRTPRLALTRSCRKPHGVGFLQLQGRVGLQQAAGCDRLAAQTVWPCGVGRGVGQLWEHVRQLRASLTALQMALGESQPARISATLRMGCRPTLA